MKVFKKIVTLICVIAISISCVVPAFAEDITSEGSANFWDFYMHFCQMIGRELPGGGLISYIDSAQTKNVCPSSADGWHHATSADSSGSDDKGNYILCTCLDCHKQFKAYLEDLKSGYEAYTSDMP